MLWSERISWREMEWFNRGDVRHRSATDQRNEFDKGDVCHGSDDEFLIEGLGLFVVDKNEKSVFGECFQRVGKLGLPIDDPVSFQVKFGPLPIQELLRIVRLDQPGKYRFVFMAVEFTHLVMDAFAQQITHSDALGEKFKGHLVEALSCRRFVSDTNQHLGTSSVRLSP